MRFNPSRVIRISSLSLFCLSFACISFAAADGTGTGDDSGIAPVLPAPGTVAPADEVSKRLFGVIPNYRADQYQSVYKPLTTAEKFKIARSDSFDWPNFLLIGGYAIQSQVASGGFHQSGWVKSFGEFYGRSEADQAVGSYLTEAILPSLLHEDPRYFRLGKGSFWQRASHATTSIVIGRRDDGSYGFAVSEVVGNMGVVAMTSFYHSEAQTAGEALERYGMNLGNDLISNMITEFWPDVKHHIPMFHHPK